MVLCCRYDSPRSRLLFDSVFVDRAPSFLGACHFWSVSPARKVPSWWVYSAQIIAVNTYQDGPFQARLAQQKITCTQEGRDAIHEYGVELQRRAREIVAAAQDHRDTADINDERVETEDREGAPAQESSALPSSGASLFAHGSSKKSGVTPKQQPQPKQMAHRKEAQPGARAYPLS